MGLLDGWRFCPLCGGPLRSEAGMVTCEQCGYVAWANSVPGAQRSSSTRAGSCSAVAATTRRPGSGTFPAASSRSRSIRSRRCAASCARRPASRSSRASSSACGCSRTPIATCCPSPGSRAPAGGVERAGDDVAELRWFAPDELPGADELAFESYVPILSLWRTRRSRRRHAQTGEVRPARKIGRSAHVPARSRVDHFAR